MEALKKVYRTIRENYRNFIAVNWVKTYYFNYKTFPYKIAKQLPVFFYGPVSLTTISGEIIIKAPIKRGMVGFGQAYEIITKAKGTSELRLEGKFVVKGHVQFGKDYFVYVGPDAYLEMGHMASLGSNGKIICKEKIVLGDYARLGYESQLIDTNFHSMMDTQTGKVYPLTAPIVIGNYNFISNRVTILQKTQTPNYCTIASNTLCNKDYQRFGENILIGGVPAKLLKENISRDWESEVVLFEKYLIR